MIRKTLCAIVACLLVVGAHASLTVDSNDAGYAKPKVATVDYDGGDSGSSKQALLAKFGIAIIGARVGTTLLNLTNGIYSRNSSTQMAIYAIPTEAACSKPASTNSYALNIWNAVQKVDWWLRKADGTRSQWSTSYGACDINLTLWGRRDASGYTWPQWIARYAKDNMLKYAPHAKWWFADNGMQAPRVDADFRRNGTNQSRKDPTVVASWRAGMKEFWLALNDGGRMRVMSNVDSDLSFSPYRTALRGAFAEGMIGRSWSLETWAGWSAMMARYRSIIANTYGHVGILHVYAGSTDYRTIRFGLASAMLEDGYFAHSPSSGTIKAVWIDEYDAPIGTPAESPPKTPKQNGIWQRRYTNGLVLVNPSKTATASIYVGSGYKRLLGTQDPTVNNGQVVTSVTLPPRSGLLLIKN